MWMNLKAKNYRDLSGDTQNFIRQLRVSFISTHIEKLQINTSYYWKIFITNSDGTLIIQVLDKQKLFKGNFQQFLQIFKGFDFNPSCSYNSEEEQQLNVQNSNANMSLGVDPRCWLAYSFCNSFNLFTSNVFFKNIPYNKTDYGTCQIQSYLINPYKTQYNVTILESFALNKQLAKQNSAQGLLTYFRLQNDEIPYSLSSNSIENIQNIQKNDNLKTIYDLYGIESENSISSLRGILSQIYQLAKQNLSISKPQQYTTMYDPSNLGQQVLLQINTEIKTQLMSYSLDQILRVLVFSPIYNLQWFKNLSKNKAAKQIDPFFFVGLNFDINTFNRYTNQTYQNFQIIQALSISVTLVLFVIALLLSHFKLKKTIVSFIDSIDWTIELMNIISNESIFDSHVNEDFINDFFKRYCLNQEAKELLQTYFILILNLIKTANEYFQEGQEEAALQKYNEAYSLFTKLGNQSGIGICLNNIGNIHFKKGNYVEACLHYSKSYQISLSEKEYITLQMINHPKQKEKLDQVKLIIAVRALQIAQTLNHVNIITNEDLSSFHTQIQASHIQNTQTRQSNQKILATPQISSSESPTNQINSQGKKSIFQTKHNQIEFDYIVEEGKNQGLVQDINYEKQLSALHLNLREKQVSQEFIQEYFTKSRAKSEIFIRQIKSQKSKEQQGDIKMQIDNQALHDKQQSQLQVKGYEKKYDMAIKYFSVAYEYFSQKQTKRSISQVTYICISMAECYLKLKKYSQSQGLINEARKRLSRCNQINFQKQILKKNIQDVDSILSNHLVQTKNQKLDLNQNYKNSIQFNSLSTHYFQLTQSVQSNQSKKEKQKNQTNKFRNTFFELQSPILFKAALQNKHFLKQNFLNFTVSQKNNISRNAKRQLSSIDDINNTLEKKNLRCIKRISSAKLTFQNKDKLKQLSPSSCKSNIQKCPSIFCIDNQSIKDTFNQPKQYDAQQNYIQKITSKQNIFQIQNNKDFKRIGGIINGFSKSQNSTQKEKYVKKNFNQQRSQEQWCNLDQGFGDKVDDRKGNISIDQQISSQKQNNQAKSSLFQKIHNSIQYLNRNDNLIDKKNQNGKKKEEGSSKKLQVFSNNQNNILQFKLQNNHSKQIYLNQEFNNTDQFKQSKENSVFLSPNISQQNTARPFLNNLEIKMQSKLNKSSDKFSQNQQPTNIPEISNKLQNQLIFDEKDDLFLPYSVLHMKISLVQGKFFKSQGERYFLKAASQFIDVLEYFDPNNQEDQYDPLDKLEAMKELLYIFQWYNCKEQVLNISEEINKMENSQVIREKISRPLFFIDSFI
ncbi:hypothetical protein ABPG72_022028 [Tetrahymena utriculariae]